MEGTPYNISIQRNYNFCYSFRSWLHYYYDKEQMLLSSLCSFHQGTKTKFDIFSFHLILCNEQKSLDFLRSMEMGRDVSGIKVNKTAGVFFFFINTKSPHQCDALD